MSKHALYPFYKPYDATKGKRVYVSGPMTGIGDNNGPAFDEAATALREMGYAVCNPNETDAILGPLSFETYMRFDYERVLEADFLVALDQWERSRGALAEILCAIRIGTPVWGWTKWTEYDRIREDRVNAAITRLYSGEVVTFSHEARAKAKAVDEGRTDNDSSRAWTMDQIGVFTNGRPSGTQDRARPIVVRHRPYSDDAVLLDEDEREVGDEMFGLSAVRGSFSRDAEG